VFNEPELGTVGGGVGDNTAIEVDPCPSKSNAGNHKIITEMKRLLKGQ